MIGMNNAIYLRNIKHTKQINMKGLLIAACSLMLVGTTYAQDNKADNRSDDDATTISNPSSLDGSPMPGADHHYHLVLPWNHIQTIALAPFQFSENGVGVGLSYERALDAEGIISVYLPVIATWNLNTRDNNNNYYYGTTSNNLTNSMYYAMPGIKFYPTGMGRIKYAVGPSAVIGVGQKVVNDYAYYNYPYTSSYNYGTLENRFLFGMMINNSLNVNATPHLYIGAELGLGFSYFDRINNVNEGTKFLTQGSFKIGYTF
jgi:hypothetical protein